jgi:hypothetical protein
MAARTFTIAATFAPGGAHTTSTTSSGHGYPSTAISSPSSTGNGRRSAQATRREAAARRRPLSQRGRISINDVPEYLAPAVYVEEVSYRSKWIEGVSTSTNGFPHAIRSGLDVVAEWVELLLVGFFR